jgi:transposase InsO family protein
MVPNELWNVDIFDMSKHAAANKGFRYLLACVDVFTRRAFVESMKNKNSVAAREAFQSIIKDAKEQPRSILIDNDAGFFNNAGSTGETFSKFLAGKQIAMQTNALKDHQAMSVNDNFATRIKSVMTKMILRHNVATWYDKIKKIVDIYNKTRSQRYTGSET